jgi:CheY-like chemotaxis protein
MNNVSKPVEILIVEDNPDDADLFVEALQNRASHPNVQVVEDGVAALKCVRGDAPYGNAHRPDLIFLDLNLPRKSGHEVLAEIKADPQLRSIPVIVLTTSTAGPDITKSYDLGASCFITKPFDLDQLLAIVDAIDSFWLRTASLLPR